MKKTIKDKIILDKDFYVFTGSTVGVVPIIQKGIYSGEVENNKVIGYRFLGKYIFTLCENSKGENNKKSIIFNRKRKRKRKRENDSLVNLFNVANNFKRNKVT